MDNSRLLIAIGLSFLVFFVWSIAFGPKPSKTPVETPPQTAAPAGQKFEKPPAQQTSPAIKQLTAESAPDTGREAVIPEKPERKITVETPLYRIVLSEKGAAVTSMVLKKYRETVAADSPYKELVPPALKDGTVLLSMSGLPAGNGLEQGVYTVDQTADSVPVYDEPVSLRFVHVTNQNIRIEKSYRFLPNSYLIDLTVTIHNGGDSGLSGAVGLALRDVSDGKQGAYGFQGPIGLINDKLEQVKVKKIEETNKIEGAIRWIAIERLYFMDSLVNKTPAAGVMALAYNDNILQNQLVIPLSEIVPGGQQSMDFSLFMGPKSISVLKSANNELARAINFGWVDVIAKPCLYFMNFIYRFIPNYGVAIIILTIISRLLFWPLAQKSYKSMSDMRKLQPLMQEIREKYKDDKVKINQETMALYRTYKINPLGGCLPMVIQLPVFFALYRMLYQAIELRHAPFFGWINDLSAPDRLFHFAFKIPFMQPPYGIPVLTLIMGATMILQQKMSPAPGDPTQAKMMMLMPVVFTFIFINFPSGLVLYWLFSNLVSIAQQYFTQKKLA